jgi:two-component system NarL family response regulator
MTSKIRILVAEDHVIARVGVNTIINLQKDMRVVAEAVNGQHAVDLYREHLPDVMLLDMRMPIISGFDAAIAIRTEFPNARIIALTSYDAIEEVNNALAAGVKAYLTKDVPHHELLETIRTVHAGGSYLPPALAARVSAQVPSKHLSAREIQVLELIARGFADKEIGYELNISRNTVTNHAKNIRSKLGVRDRTSAATIAIRRGIIGS